MSQRRRIRDDVMAMKRERGFAFNIFNILSKLHLFKDSHELRIHGLASLPGSPLKHWRFSPCLQKLPMISIKQTNIPQTTEGQ
jgi:hypothetical protein